MASRKESPVVSLARRKVHKIIQEQVAELRRQAEQETDLYAVQDLKRLADEVEKAVFGDGPD